MDIDASMEDMYKWAAIILGVLLIMVIIFICLASAQIKRTTALVSEGTKVVKNSPAMIFVPMAIYAAQIVSVSICALILAYLWTDPAKSYESALGWAEKLLEAGNSTSEITIAVDASDLFWYEVMYVAFGALWTYLFFEAIETTVISGCVVYYYFIDQDTAGIKDQRYEDNQTDFITLSMVAHVVRCNLGTMAFGSLILALIEVARIILEWIDKQTESVQDSNVLLRYALKCCKCFLFCFERSIKFLTSYAYTFVILENRGFCSACAMSYGLLKEYGVQISINKVVCVVLYWIQSITTPIICALLGYRVMVELDPEIQAGIARPFDYYGPLIPTCAIFFLAFMMARSFAGVYEQTVTSLTVCVLNDISKYDPPFIQKQMYEAFELSPPWGERLIAHGPSGEPKDPSQQRPFSKRSMYGNKGTRVTSASMNRRDGYSNMR
jgi:choline transporter-like protein 2/4/5